MSLKKLTRIGFLALFTWRVCLPGRLAYRFMYTRFSFALRPWNSCTRESQLLMWRWKPVSLLKAISAGHLRRNSALPQVNTQRSEYNYLLNKRESDVNAKEVTVLHPGTSAGFYLRKVCLTPPSRERLDVVK